MYLSQDIKSISYLKAKTADVINNVNDNQRTIIITQNGEAKAVVQGENDIENNNTIEQEKLFG
ncbi:MAG: type II toxin-antitoxin system Phd/YefM family antitoxin [Campylobacterota bacterium]|nr:type II toxin-antitoxin system Phd/YefM family antitoxin [Campylobacterota bacterium]